MPVSCCWGALGEFIFARTRMPDVVWLVAAGILAGPVSGLIPAGPLKAAIPFFGAIVRTVISVLATLSIQAGVAGAESLAPGIFAVIVLSVLVFTIGFSIVGRSPDEPAERNIGR